MRDRKRYPDQCANVSGHAAHNRLATAHTSGEIVRRQVDKKVPEIASERHIQQENSSNNKVKGNSMAAVCRSQVKEI